MGFIVFEEEAFNYLDAQLENFVKRMDRIRERSEDKTMNKWLDTQDVMAIVAVVEDKKQRVDEPHREPPQPNG